jgi:microcystin-dependent protein
MDVFLGMIAPFGFNFAPRGWMFCNGQILLIAQNTALFSLLGTQYGGNGQTTFALPDLRGRMPISQFQGNGLTNRTIGEVGGVETVTLLTSNMPPHTHSMNAASAAPTATSPAGNMLTQMTSRTYVAGPTTVTMSPQTISITGQGFPFGIMPPYLVVNWCIAVNGIFPSRN